jgi:hypothetical protein
MKTLAEICVEIKSLTYSDVVAVGSKLIEEYVEAVNNKLKVTEIYDKLEPYAGEKLKSFWKNKIEQPLVPFAASSNGHLTACYVGFTVERTIAKLDKEGLTTDWVLPEEYQAFAELLNKAVDLDLIEHGVVIEPFTCALAVISPARRTMLCFYCFTSKSLQELHEYSNAFCNEGELPHIMEEIQFHPEEDFDYQDWIMKRYSK